MNYKLNHSRYIDKYARDTGDRAYWKAKRTPTAKQIKFYRWLYAKCKENGVETDTGEYTKTRAEYAFAIDKLITRLQENGIDVRGNDKMARRVLHDVVDRRGRRHIRDSIEITEDKKT